MKLRLFTLLLVALVLTACGGETAATPTAANPTAATSAASGQLTVFAAASLKDAFTRIGTDFEAANPGTTVTFNFAGSQQLAAQIGQGAPVDVFASASGGQMQAAIKSGRIISGTQRIFTRNRLAIIVPKDNPAGINEVADLAKSNLRLVLADKSVPAGQYAREMLAKAAADPTLGANFSDHVLANVVSNEQDVRAVYTKVSLGEAEAGVVYVSDAVAGGSDKVARVDIPDQYNVVASYPLAMLNDSKNAATAQAFASYILSPSAQAVLTTYGFAATDTR